MPSTTNFNWTTPADTDLVKDGASAIRTLANGIDTSFVDLKGGTTGQVLSKASNTDLDFTWVADASGIPATIFDAKGDIIAATAADTASRLAVGTNGQVLTADSTAATGLKWAGVSVADNWSLLNSGGTNLTGASTITVSGITGVDKLFILVQDAGSGGSATISIRFNSDTANNYKYGGERSAYLSTYNAGNFGAEPNSGVTSRDQIYLGNPASSTQTIYGGLTITGIKSTTGPKVFSSVGAGTGTSGHESYILQGIWDNTAALTSVSILTSSNFDTGKIWVYGA